MTTSDTGEVKIESIIEDEVEIKKILVPPGWFYCLIRAAKYAIEVEGLQNTQVYCVHAINTMPYGYNLPGSLLINILKVQRIRLNLGLTKLMILQKKKLMTTIAVL